MVLMNCSECEGKVSDKASACPHCGCPLRYSANATTDLTTDSSGEEEIGAEEVPVSCCNSCGQRYEAVRTPDLILSEDDGDCGHNACAGRRIIPSKIPKMKVLAWACAAFCLLAPFKEGSETLYKAHNNFITGVGAIHAAFFLLESLVVFLIAFLAYKNTYALKSFILVYLSAAVLLFPPWETRLGECGGFAFLGVNASIHTLIWSIEIFLVAIGFYLLSKQKNR